MFLVSFLNPALLEKLWINFPAFPANAAQKPFIIMKNIQFFATFALCCLLLGMTSCDKRENQVSANGETATEENTTVAHNPGEDSGGLTFRVPCVDAYDCEVEIVVTSGTANITVCGISDGSFSCSGTTSCGTLYTLAETYTTDHFSFCVSHGGTFRVRNNDGSTVTIDLTVGGNTLPDQHIAGNSSADFDITPECAAVVTC